MSKYKPKPGPSAPFSVILLRSGGRTEVVAVCDPGDEMLAITGVRESRPKIAEFEFMFDRIEKDTN